MRDVCCVVAEYEVCEKFDEEPLPGAHQILEDRLGADPASGALSVRCAGAVTCPQIFEAQRNFGDEVVER